MTTEVMSAQNVATTRKYKSELMQQRVRAARWFLVVAGGACGSGIGWCCRDRLAAAIGSGNPPSAVEAIGEPVSRFAGPDR